MCLGEELEILVNMENFAQQFIGGELEETIMSATSPSATPDVTSNFHTAVEECNLSSLDEVALADCIGAGSSMEPKSEYFSLRVEEMMRSKSQFSSAVEHEIEYSRSHWTEVSGLSKSSEDKSENEVSGSSESSEDNNENGEMWRVYYEDVDRENEKVFTELMNDPQWKHHERGDFFWKLPSLPNLGPKLDPKIAEGGQAEIFELTDSNDNVYPDFLLKVFKKGTLLSQLRKQWPCGILQREVMGIVFFGWMLDDGRFAFVMARCWGDLRKLIDQAMQEKNNQGPPFPYGWSGRTLHAKDIMRRIAYYMDVLHKQGILHQDLKAANILLMANDKGYSVIVADYECSIEVSGTGFWRAPEILLAMKNRSVINFTKKVDVYSYGMTCFEIVTGHLPFEGELKACRDSNDLVIAGQRPKFPSDVDVTMKDVIERCWNLVPNERPSFVEVFELLSS